MLYAECYCWGEPLRHSVHGPAMAVMIHTNYLSQTSCLLDKNHFAWPDYWMFSMNLVGELRIQWDPDQQNALNWGKMCKSTLLIVVLTWLNKWELVLNVTVMYPNLTNDSYNKEILLDLKTIMRRLKNGHSFLTENWCAGLDSPLLVPFCPWCAGGAFLSLGMTPGQCTPVWVSCEARVIMLDHSLIMVTILWWIPIVSVIIRQVWIMSVTKVWQLTCHTI